MILLGLLVGLGALALVGALYLIVSHDPPGPYGAERANDLANSAPLPPYGKSDVTLPPAHWNPGS